MKGMLLTALSLLLLLAPAGKAGVKETAPSTPAGAAEAQQGGKVGDLAGEETQKGIVLPGQVSPTSSEAVAKTAETLTELISLHPDDEPAVLVLRNRPVVTLRARYTTNSPEERAEGAVGSFSKALARAAAESRDLEVSVREFKVGNLLMIGDVAIVGITPLDLDPLGVETLEDATAEAVENLELILSEIREERSVQAILRAIGLSALATLVFILLLWVANRVQGFLLRGFEAGLKAVDKSVDTDTIAEANKVTALTRNLIVFAAWAVRLFLAFSWVAFTLKQFPYTRPWGETAGTFVVETIKGVALGIVHALPNILSVLLIFVVARILARLVRAFFASVEAGKVRTPWVFPETAMPTRRLLVALIWAFALVAMYPYLPGSGSEAFKGLGLILGLMISLGGSGVVSQAMSGMVLMYSRALSRGDYVRIGDTEGVVLSLGMLATKIRTLKREEITIPNAVVMSTSTKNFSRLAGRDGVILHTTVTIGYDAPWRKVHEQLLEAVDRTEGLKKAPPPFVMQNALSDFFVEYQVNAYLLRPEKRLPVLAELHANIQDTFNEAGIAIVSPHYVADPPHPAPEEGPA
jgi:small-conductance mechanosensitive channel